MHTTPPSLLDQLRQPTNQPAWERFVALYAPLLQHWARRLGLQTPDSDNLVQEVFVTLLEELPRFHYQPGRRFRGWLWTVTLNKQREMARVRAPVQAATEELHGQVAGDDIAEVEEAEYRRYVVDRALRLMQADFEPATWRAFWEYVVNGRSPAEVAAELGITRNAVHLAKARVLRRLREELAGLID